MEFKGISLQCEYLSEGKFIKFLIAMCADLFAYRVVLSQEQYVKMEAPERKMILVLDLYDIVKQVRKQSKVDAKLDFRDPKWEHPCDIALKDYVLCDHKENLKKNMQFRINATLLKSDLEIKHLAPIQDLDLQGKESIEKSQMA